MTKLPPGKVPWDTVADKVRGALPPEVILGPGLGEDAALLRLGSETWAVASDPITFTAEDAGRLAVIVNANDVAVRGARPLFFLAVILVAPEEAEEARVQTLLDQVGRTCRNLGVTLIGGHTEVTPGLPHTVVVGTMLGRVADRVLTTGGLGASDLLGITKWAGLEGTAILMSEYAARLQTLRGKTCLRGIDGILGENWLSVVPEASIGAANSAVTALHDVTEGGVGEALHEMACAAGLFIEVDASAVPLLSETRLLCSSLGLDPLGLIGSGSLLVGCKPHGRGELQAAMQKAGIPLRWIGSARAIAPAEGPGASLPRFQRDEILKAGMLRSMQTCVFDMDGTLIDSHYDWLAIKAQLGVTGISIIDDLNSYPSPEREAKWRVLEAIERRATLAAEVKPGAAELLSLLSDKGIKTALVTNNTDDNVAHLLNEYDLSFDVVLTRDSGFYKPSGAPVVEAMKRLGATPQTTLCVGDSRYDVLASRDARCRWVCILHDAHQRFSPEADLCFLDIPRFTQHLELVLP